jgi:hypothetical protein
MTKLGIVTKKIIEQHRVSSHITHATVPAHLWRSYSELWRTGLCHWTNYGSVTNNIRSITTVLRHRSPHGTFSIRRVHVRPTVTYPWRLQFVIKVSAWSFLHATCTCETLLHLTCGTRWLACHVSDLWDPTSPFSISIRHVGPDGLWTLSPSDSWPDGLCVTCGPFLHPTCGTRRLMCHVYLWDLSPSPSNLWDSTACVSLVVVRV